MAQPDQDSFGNYQALMSDPLVGYIAPQAGPDFYGTGNPNGVVTAGQGTTYVDISTGDFYVKQVGSNDQGWTLVTGGGGGGTVEVYFGSGDPNGTVTANRPAAFYTANGDWWIKTSAGTTNTGWVQLIQGS